MSQFAKAYTALGATLAAALGTAMLDGNLTNGELLASLGAALVAGAAVYKVRNV